MELPVTADRTIQKVATPDKIVGVWKKVVEEVVRSAKIRLGTALVSVNVGGSVANGSVRENESDIDTYLIVDLPKDMIDEAEQTWIKDERKRIHVLFPFLRGVEMHLTPATQISEARKFNLKTLSALVYGKDVVADLPAYKLDQETLGRVRVNISKDLDRANHELKSLDDAKRHRAGKWIAKRLIRSAGMLVLWKGDTFTMDIALLVERFSKQYPNRASDIECLQNLASGRTEDLPELSQIVNSFGAWLVEEDARVFTT